MKKIIFFLTVCLLFSFTSCTNFMNGADLVEKLDKIMEEVNKPEVEVLIQSNQNWGNTLPAGKAYYKIEKPYSVIFAAMDTYLFLRWEAVNSETEIPFTDEITFEDATKADTYFTINKEIRNILIQPVCVVRPEISTYLPVEGSTNSRDESIVITYSQDISMDNDLSLIKITCGGNNVIDNFLPPVLNGNQITITPNISNLIDVDEGKTKTIEVIVPGDFYYEKNGIKISAGAERRWTFKINNTTKANAEINCNVATEKGVVSPSGNKVYNIGDEFELKFVPNDGYNFSYWNILGPDGNEIDPTILKVENKNSLTTKVKVLAAVKGVNINPKALKRLLITDVEPQSSSRGTNCDSQIKVLFNKNVLSSCITKDNISIKDAFNSDLSGYFNDPVLILDSNELYCTGFTCSFNYAKLNDIRNFINESNGFIDINLRLNSNAIVDIEGVKLESDYLYSYRVNTSVESEKPVIENLSMAKTREELSTSAKLSDKEYSLTTWAQLDYEKNHIKDLWIQCNASDIGSGVKSIQVKETIITTSSGDDKNQTQTQIFNYTDSPFLYSFIHSYDGLYCIEINVIDEVGNISENNNCKTKFYVIRDTNFEELIKTFSEIESYTSSNTIVSKQNVENHARRIYFYNVLADNWYGNGTYFTSAEDLNYKVLWGTDKNSLTNVLSNISFVGEKYVTAESSSKNCWSFELPKDEIDVTKNLYYQIIITDAVGNEITLDNEISAGMKIRTVEVAEENETTGKCKIVLDAMASENNSDWATIIYYEGISKTGGDPQSFRYHLNGRIFISPSDSAGTITIQNLNTRDYDYVFYAQKVWGKWQYGVFSLNSTGFLGEGQGTKVYLNGSNPDYMPDFNFTIQSKGLSTSAYIINWDMDENLYKKYKNVLVWYKRRESNTIKNYTYIANTNSGSIELGYKDVLQYNYSYSGGHNGAYWSLDGTDLISMGIICYTDDEMYTCEKQMPDYTTFVVDNIPPSLTRLGCGSYDSSVIELLTPKDEHSSIPTDSDGLSSARIYFVPFRNEWNGISDVASITGLTVDQIKECEYKDLKYNPSATYLDVELSKCFEEGNYLLVLNCKDELNNELFGPISIYRKKNLNSKPSVTITKENKENVVINNDNTTSETRDVYKAVLTYKEQTSTCIYTNRNNVPFFHVQWFNTETNKWEETNTIRYAGSSINLSYGVKKEQPSGISYGNTVAQGTDVTYSIYGYTNYSTYNYITLSEKFIRVFVNERYLKSSYNASNFSEDSDKHGNSYAIPLYYYQKSDCTGGILNKVGDNYIPICEQPCLITTVYSPVNLGDNPDKWESNTTYAQHLKPRQITNLNTYEPDVEHVERGNYYCVIAHFANGTSQMGPISVK